YEYVYGMNTPASYSMPGHAGGLIRIDELFKFNTYETAFNGSPMVFGAFPSLHSACAIIQTLFISYTLPKSLGGGVYAIVTFWFAWDWLPPVNITDNSNDSDDNVDSTLLIQNNNSNASIPCNEPNVKVFNSDRNEFKVEIANI
ncbi:22207_t:CDS:2, partial [Racocetra persica]